MNDLSHHRDGHRGYFIQFLMLKPALKLIGVLVVLAVMAGAAQARDIRAAHPFLKDFFKVDGVDPPLSSNAFFFRGLAADTLPVQPTAVRGHWLIINVWATWCAPCLYELPGFDVLQAANPGLRVWAVSVDTVLDPRAMAATQKRLGLVHVPLYHDYGRVLAQVMNTKSLPATMVIDPKGQIRAVLYGQNDWSGAEAHGFINALPDVWPVMVSSSP